MPYNVDTDQCHRAFSLSYQISDSWAGALVERKTVVKLLCASVKDSPSYPRCTPSIKPVSHIQATCQSSQSSPMYTWNIESKQLQCCWDGSMCANVNLRQLLLKSCKTDQKSLGTTGKLSAGQRMRTGLLYLLQSNCREKEQERKYTLINTLRCSA